MSAFTKEQWIELQEVLNNRDERMERVINRAVCGLAKRTKSFLVPLSVLQHSEALFCTILQLQTGQGLGANVDELVSANKQSWAEQLQRQLSAEQDAQDAVIEALDREELSNFVLALGLRMQALATQIENRLQEPTINKPFGDATRELVKR